MNPLDACEQHAAGRDCEIHGPLIPKQRPRGVRSPDRTDRGGRMPPMSLPELRQVMRDIVATQRRGPLHGQGSISGTQVQGLERGVELLDVLLGDTSEGLKAA